MRLLMRVSCLARISAFCSSRIAPSACVQSQETPAGLGPPEGLGMVWCPPASVISDKYLYTNFRTYYVHILWSRYLLGRHGPAPRPFRQETPRLRPFTKTQAKSLGASDLTRPGGSSFVSRIPAPAPVHFATLVRPVGPAFPRRLGFTGRKRKLLVMTRRWRAYALGTREMSWRWGASRLESWLTMIAASHLIFEFDGWQVGTTTMGWLGFGDGGGEGRIGLVGDDGPRCAPWELPVKTPYSHSQGWCRQACQRIASPFPPWPPPQCWCHASCTSLTRVPSCPPLIPHLMVAQYTRDHRQSQVRTFPLPPTAKRVSPPHHLFPPVFSYPTRISALGAPGCSKVPKLPQSAGLAPLRSFLIFPALAPLVAEALGQLCGTSDPLPMYCRELFETEPFSCCLAFSVIGSVRSSRTGETRDTE